MRTLGVDDWAWRNGQPHGTIWVDLEGHGPSTGSRIGSPRGSRSAYSAPGRRVHQPGPRRAYADDASRDAPDSVQIADRFHLLRNLTVGVQ